MGALDERLPPGGLGGPQTAPYSAPSAPRIRSTLNVNAFRDCSVVTCTSDSLIRSFPPEGGCIDEARSTGDSKGSGADSEGNWR